MTAPHGNAIVFLDIDDVLCLCDRFGAHEAPAAAKGEPSDGDSVFRSVMHAPAVAVLRDLHEQMGGAVWYVISSSGDSSSRGNKCVRSSAKPDLGSSPTAWKTKSAGRRRSFFRRIVMARCPSGLQSTTTACHSLSSTTWSPATPSPVRALAASKVGLFFVQKALASPQIDSTTC